MRRPPTFRAPRSQRSLGHLARSITLVALACVAGGSSASAATTTWLDRGTHREWELHRQGFEAPSVAVDAHGNADAIWTLSASRHSAVRTAHLRAGSGAWGQATALTAPTTFGLFGGTKVAENARGDAVAVWTARTGDVVEAARRPAGSTHWTRPHVISGAFPVGGDIDADLSVIVDAGGGATVAWAQFDGVPVVASLPAGSSTWQPAVELDQRDLVEDTAPVIAADAAGDVLAVWCVYLQANDTQCVRSLRPAHSPNWQPAVAFNAISNDVGQPALAINARGDAAIVLAFHVRGRGIVLDAVTTRSGSASWAAPTTLTSSGDAQADDYDPAVAVAPDGTIAAAWCPHGKSDTATLAAGKPHWSQFQRIGTPLASGYGPGGPSIALDAADDAFIAWPEETEQFTFALTSAWRRAGSNTWQGQRRHGLLSRDETVAPPALAVQGRSALLVSPIWDDPPRGVIATTIGASQ